MSDTVQTSSLIQLATIFRDDIVKQINRAAPLTSLLRAERGYNASGPNWVAQSSGHAARTHSEGASFDGAASDAQAQATLGWGLYDTSFVVTDEAMARAAAGGNPMGNVKLFAKNMLDAAEQLGKKIEGDLFTGTGSNSIIGLADAIDDSNTYAGINRASATYWRSTVKAPGTLTTLSKAQIEGDLAEISVAGGMRPNLAVCSPLVFAKVLGLFDSERQFMTPTGSNGGKPVLGDPSLAVAYVSGCMFVEAPDGYASANNGSIYYLNSNHVHMEYIPYVEVAGFTSMALSMPSLPFALDVVMGAKTSHASKGVLRCQVQLVVDRPNTMGVRQDIQLA